MGKIQKPITGALRNGGELKHILRYNRDTKIYIAPGWYTQQWGDHIIMLELDKSAFFKRGILHQAHGVILPGKDDIYLNKLTTRNRPFRIIEAMTTYNYGYYLVDGKPHFIFTNYFHAYAYMLRRRSHGQDALHSGFY